MNSSAVSPKNQDVSAVKRAERIANAAQAVNRAVVNGRTEHNFWKFLAEDGHGHTPFAHEYITLQAIFALIERGILDRENVFSTDGFGMVDYVKTISDALIDTMPYVVDHYDPIDLMFLMAGRPAPTESTPAPASTVLLTFDQRLAILNRLTPAQLAQVDAMVTQAEQNGAE